MKLRLAEYKEGKFERFLELGKDFVFGGDWIFFHNPTNQHQFFREVSPAGVLSSAQGFYDWKLDSEDPLNRFNGLFNGRTYGEGRFVLLIGFELNGQLFFQDQVAKDGREIIHLSFKPDESFSCCYDSNAFGILYDFGSHHYGSSHKIKIIGNLHENPELYEKLTTND